jgi:hydroxymethylbilane synthase
MSKSPSPDCTDTRAPSPSATFVLGTRKSALALVQADLVAEALRALYPSPTYDFPIKSMSTVGDRNQTTPLHLLAAYSPNHPAKSLWTDELEASLMTGGMDMIVHALKDVPTTLKDGCEIACMLEREDPRDAFVGREGLEYKKLEDLPDGSVVGTGSVRRVAQLRRKFPNLKFEDMVSDLSVTESACELALTFTSSAATCEHFVQFLSIKYPSFVHTSTSSLIPFTIPIIT